jgi:molybdopterin converting factor small subunit
MEVTIKLGEPIWKVVGEKSTKLVLNGAHSLSDVFAELNRHYPAFMAEVQRGEFDLPYTLFVNDKMVTWEKVGQTPVNNGDKVFIFMAVSGG